MSNTKEKELAFKTAIRDITSTKVGTPAAMLISHDDKDMFQQEAEYNEVVKHIIPYCDASNNLLSRKGSMLSPYSNSNTKNKPKDPKIDKLKKIFGY